MGVIGGKEVADDCVPGPSGSNLPRPFSQACVPQPCAPCVCPSSRVLTEAVLHPQKDTISAIAEVAVELRGIKSVLSEICSTLKDCWENCCTMHGSLPIISQMMHHIHTQLQGRCIWLIVWWVRVRIIGQMEGGWGSPFHWAMLCSTAHDNTADFCQVVQKPVACCIQSSPSPFQQPDGALHGGTRPTVDVVVGASASGDSCCRLYKWKVG